MSQSTYVFEEILDYLQVIVVLVTVPPDLILLYPSHEWSQPNAQFSSSVQVFTKLAHVY